MVPTWHSKFSVVIVLTCVSFSHISTQICCENEYSDVPLIQNYNSQKET